MRPQDTQMASGRNVGEDRRAALVEKVANRMKRTDECHPRGHATWEEMADEVIDLIRAEVLEEAAREFNRWGDIYGDNAAAAIRALKER